MAKSILWVGRTIGIQRIRIRFRPRRYSIRLTKHGPLNLLPLRCPRPGVESVLRSRRSVQINSFTRWAASRLDRQSWASNSSIKSRPQITPTPISPGIYPSALSVIDPGLGIISGKPINSVYGKPVSFAAKNSSGIGPRKDVSFYVQPSPTPGPVIISSTCATGKADPGNTFTFQVLKDNASRTASLTASGLPYPGLTIDPVSGLISGKVASTSDNALQTFGVALTLTDTLPDGTPPQLNPFCS